ncbi:hypothetical protein EMIT0194P_20016 [Pseudomonas serbica]
MAPRPRTTASHRSDIHVYLAKRAQFRGKTIKNQRLKEHMHMLERVLAAAVRHRRIACLW